MTAYVALLRGINVGGNKLVAMADVRTCAERLGFEDVKTLLNSGNLVFRAKPKPAPQLEALLEREIDGVDCLVRSAAEWQAIIKKNPFRKEAKADPGHLLMMAFKVAPLPVNVKVLQAAITGREVVRVNGREAFFYYPDGVGRSKLTHTVIEKKLATRGTARNWNTVLKLAALMED